MRTTYASDQQAHAADRDGDLAPRAAQPPTFLNREGALYAGWGERFAPFLAEAIGGFVLTACYLYNAAGDPVWAISSNALMVTALVIAFGHVSGANLNPSVSIALCLSGRQALSTTVPLCLAQLFGASCAVFCVLDGVSSVAEAINIGPKDGYGPGDVFLVELIFTSMICFVFLNCGASSRNNPRGDQNGFLGLALGFCFVAGGHACRHVSGSVMNPAIAFGVQLTNFKNTDPNAWATFYLIAELAGAFLAAGAIRVVRPSEHQDRELTSSGPAPGQLQVADGRQSTSSSSAVMAEFIGSFYIALTKVFVHANLSPNEPWAVGMVVASMVYSLRGVSGAHLNPANTIAVALSGRGAAEFWQGASYVGAQILASITAAWVFAMVNLGRLSFEVRAEGVHATYGAIVLSELLFTFMLCYVVLSTSLTFPVPMSASQQNNIAGLAQGSCVMVSGFAIGKISGGILNPAFAIGYTGLAGLGGRQQTMVWPYIFYEVLGAVLASGAFLVTHPSKYFIKNDELWSGLSSAV